MKKLERNATVIVFAKAPRLGTVKTRVAKDIGNAAALVVYKALLERTFDALEPLENVEIVYTPDDAGATFEAFARHTTWSLRPQGPGNLGARLSRAARVTLRSGRRPIFIGADCPTIQTSDLQSAANALTTRDVVIGPATDGGYWLIGLARWIPEVFADIPWSQPNTLETTRARLATVNASVAYLDEKSDIDTLEDLRRHPDLTGAWTRSK